MNRSIPDVVWTTLHSLTSCYLRKHVISIVCFLVLFFAASYAGTFDQLNVTAISTNHSSSYNFNRSDEVAADNTSSVLLHSTIAITINSTVHSPPAASETIPTPDPNQLNTTVATSTESTTGLPNTRLPSVGEQLLSLKAAAAATAISANVAGNVNNVSTRLSLGAASGKKGYDEDSSDEDDNEKSKHKSNSLLYLLYQVSNRTAQCSLLNGTCTAVTDCSFLTLAYLGNHGHGGHGKLGTGFYDCNLTTICCSPFLLVGLFNSHSADHDDDDTDTDDESDHSTEPYGYSAPSASSGYGQSPLSVNTGYGAAPAPADQSYPSVVPLSSYGRRRRRRQRHRVARRRTRRGRGSTHHGLHGFIGTGFSGVSNLSALCLLRNGICVAPSDCATNSAIRPGGGYGGLHGGLLGVGHSDDHSDDDEHKGHRQINSFLCNYTAICCLPLFDSYTGFGLSSSGLYSGVSSGLYGREATSYRELASSDEDARRSRRHRRQRRTQPALPVADVRLSSDVERQALCAKSNGTCVVPASCEAAEVYDKGRMNFHCNLTSICCLPQYSSLERVFAVGQQLAELTGKSKSISSR